MSASVTARPKAAQAPAPATTHAQTHAPSAGTAPSAPSAPAATQRASRRPARDKAAAAPTPTQVAAAPAQTQQLAAPVEASGSTLDPLLLVAGVSTAVTVFCLLLMTSRPALRPGSQAPQEGPGTVAAEPDTRST